MSNPFVAEIRIFAGSFAPTGWALCNGQLIPISQNTALFSLLGTFYGGDGKSTFALPNLQGSAPMHQGQGPGLSQRFLGEQGGEPAVTLLQSEMPGHSHGAKANAAGNDQVSPVNNVWGALGTTRTPPPLYQTTQNTQMSPFALSLTGGSLPHNNMSPYLALTFIIAMQGVYPARN
jgi:microcystin-dependent protein